MVEGSAVGVRFDREGNVIEYVRSEHDEAMRMQALAIGAQMTATQMYDGPEREKRVAASGRWAYREATGREW